MTKPAKDPSLPWQQLIILSICRFAEPVAITSVLPYLPGMIESFNVPENDVALWAGISAGVFSAAQCLTAIGWGRASDYYGRKPTILLGLTGTMTASLLFGFSRSLPMAIATRFIGGACSGTVGIIRTTVAEMVPHKSLQPRAFSIMPLVWSMGSVMGPILGGALAEPVKSLPEIFGKIEFFRTFPYALPNLVISVFYVIGLVTGFLFLKETLVTKRYKLDIGQRMGNLLVRSCASERKASRPDVDEEEPLLKKIYDPLKKSDPPAFSEVFTPQSNLNLTAYTLLALHSMAYDQLMPVFLHHPRQEHWNGNADVQLPLKFAGGFNLPTRRIGLLLMIYGIAAMIVQFLIFPPVAKKYGVLKCYKGCTMAFPLVYFLTPFMVLFPTPFSQQIAALSMMILKCFAGVFAFPCSIIMLTNSARSVRLLGTLNGVATAISAVGRAIGPGIGGPAFTFGVDIGYVILPFWIITLFGIAAHIPVWWLEEGEGFGPVVEDEDGTQNVSTELMKSPTSSYGTGSSSDGLPKDFLADRDGPPQSGGVGDRESAFDDDASSSDERQLLVYTVSNDDENRQRTRTRRLSTVVSGSLGCALGTGGVPNG